MLQEHDIEINLKCQQYSCESYMRNEDESESVFLFESKQKAEDVRCPYCGGRVNISGLTNKHLKDIPLWEGMKQSICFLGHRYRCVQCGRKFTEDIPMRYPGTRITDRAAAWIKSLLRNKVSIRGIQNLTGIHWDTIRRIHKGMMEDTLEKRKQELLAVNYHPRILAVDEFAIHKGHTYATCVMDLESGEVLWVGKGRSKADFAKFFDEIEPSFLTGVMAVAMDMNASYYLLIQKKLPHAQIVYDRYHMQAQFGKEVLGAVRLAEARRHKAQADALKQTIHALDKEHQKEVRERIQAEKKQYTQIKKLRWSLLTNGASLDAEKTQHLQSILQEHSDLAVCYAMKEELCRLFTLRDPLLAESAWKAWFTAAKESGIPDLVRFAELKEKRIGGLISHASFPISTGKLEGFNNKIKVAKRIGYGYRDDDYFFLIVKFLSALA